MKFRFSPSQKMLLPSLVFIYAMNFMDRSVLGIVGEAMKADMGFTDAQIGLLHSILLMTLIAILIPSSIINDVWKRRKFIGLAAGLWGLAMAGTAAATSFVSLVCARMLGSVNEAATASGSTAWLSTMYPAEQRSRVLGIFQMAAPLGMAFGTLLGSAVLALTGNWRLSFALFVIPAICAAIVIPQLPDRQPPAQSGFFSGMKTLLKKRVLVIVGVAAGFFCIIKYAYQAWMPVMLIRTYGLEPQYAGPMAACFLLAGVAGPFIGGILADFWTKHDDCGRVKCAAFLMGVIVVSKVVFYYLLGKVSLPVICAVGVVDGIILMMPIPVYFSVVMDVVEPQYRGSAVGIFGAVCFLTGGAWGPVLVGILSDLLGGGAEGLLYAMASLLIFAVISSGLYVYCLRHYRQERV